MATRVITRHKRPKDLTSELARQIADALNMSWPVDAEGNDEPVWVTDYQHEGEIEVAVKVSGEDSPLDRARLEKDDEAIVAAVVAGRKPKPGPAKKRRHATRAM